MKNVIISISLLFLSVLSLYSQNINGRISSSVYTFERFENKDTSDTYIRGFQNLTLSMNKGNFSIRTNLNFESEFSKTIDKNNRVRFYNLYFEGRNLFDIFSFKLGRQSSYSNISGGLYDGLSLDLKIHEYLKVSGFFGGVVAPYQELKFTENLTDNFLSGAKISFLPFSGLNLSLAYNQKNVLPTKYKAYRIDENLNPVEYLIQLKSNQYRFGAFSADYEFGHTLTSSAAIEYDLNFEEISKIELFSRINPTKNLGLEVFYNHRAPLIRYNSIFAVFDYANTDEIEIGGDYSFSNKLTINGRFGLVKFKDENSSRISLGLNYKFASLSYRKTLGNLGEQDAISLYSAYSVLNNQLTPSLGLTYTSYRLSKDDPKNDLISLSAGLNYRLLKNLSFDIQGQYMSNKIYKNDMRLFFRINYWFNYTNLNLL